MASNETCTVLTQNNSDIDGDDIKIVWIGSNKTFFMHHKKGCQYKSGLSIIRDLRAIGSNYYTRYLGYDYSLSDSYNIKMKNDHLQSFSAASYKISNQHFENSINIMFKIDYIFTLSNDEFENCYSMMHLLLYVINNKSNKRFNHDYYNITSNTSNYYSFGKKSSWTNYNLKDLERSCPGWTSVHSAHNKNFQTKGMMDQMTQKEWKIMQYKNQWDIRLYQLSQWISYCDSNFYQNYNVDLRILLGHLN